MRKRDGCYDEAENRLGKQYQSLPTAFSTKLESSSLWMTYQFLIQDLCGLEVVWLHGFAITAPYGEKKVCTTQLKTNNQQPSLEHYDLKEPFSK